jgi:hypothetical protein
VFFSRWLKVSVGWAFAIIVGACQSQSVPVVHVSLGDQPEQRRSFQPKSSLAEYVELPGVGAELRVILSSHEMSCETSRSLAKDQILVSLTFSVPTGQKMGPMVFPWTTSGNSDTSGDAGPSATSGPNVMPYVRIGKTGYSLPPGGQAEITELLLDPQGYVRGVLRLEQPGTVGVAATSVLGSFSARWCRVSSASSSDSP